MATEVHLREEYPNRQALINCHKQKYQQYRPSHFEKFMTNPSTLFRQGLFQAPTVLPALITALGTANTLSLFARSYNRSMASMGETTVNIVDSCIPAAIATFGTTLIHQLSLEASKHKIREWSVLADIIISSTKKAAIPTCISISLTSIVAIAPSLTEKQIVHFACAYLLKTASKIPGISIPITLIVGLTVIGLSYRFLQNLYYLDPPLLPPDGYFKQVPLEIVHQIFSYVAPDKKALSNFLSVSKWTTQVGSAFSSDWRKQIIKKRLPKDIIALLEQKLGSNILSEMTEIPCPQGAVLVHPPGENVRPDELTLFFEPNHPIIDWPTKNNYKMSSRPSEWPIIKTGPASPPAPFMTEINAQALKGKRVGWTITPANTLALFIVQKFSYFDTERHRERTIDCFYVLQQASPFNKQDWLIVDLTMDTLPLERAGGRDPRKPGETYEMARLKYDQNDQLDSRCYQQWNVLTRILEPKMDSEDF